MEPCPIQTGSTRVGHVKQYLPSETSIPSEAIEQRQGLWMDAIGQLQPENGQQGSIAICRLLRIGRVAAVHVGRDQPRCLQNKQVQPMIHRARQTACTFHISPVAFAPSTANLGMCKVCARHQLHFKKIATCLACSTLAMRVRPRHAVAHVKRTHVDGRAGAQVRQAPQVHAAHVQPHVADAVRADAAAGGVPAAGAPRRLPPDRLQSKRCNPQVSADKHLQADGTCPTMSRFWTASY
jgi:hypothetical protein